MGVRSWHYAGMLGAALGNMHSVKIDGSSTIILPHAAPIVSCTIL